MGWFIGNKTRVPRWNDEVRETVVDNDGIWKKNEDTKKFVEAKAKEEKSSKLNIVMKSEIMVYKKTKFSVRQQD